MGSTPTLATEDKMENYFEWKLAVVFFLVAAFVATVGSIILDHINPAVIQQEEEQEDDW